MPTRPLTIGKRRLTLDARPDRLDLRDFPYRPPLGNLPPSFPADAEVSRLLPAYAEAGLLLNQGQEGACTGFGLAAVINYLRFRQCLGEAAGAAPGVSPVRVSPAMLYQLALLYDEWPGEDYEGSSCRGALKGWHRHGVCREALWPYTLDAEENRVPTAPLEDPQRPDDPCRNWDVDALACTLGVYYRVDVNSVVDLQAALRETGAVYVSGVVHEGWNVKPRKRLRGHADLATITHLTEPKDPGGHAYALVGYNELGFVVQNSWGPGWGSHGFALQPYEDWLQHGNDAWVCTLGVPRQQALVAGSAKATAKGTAKGTAKASAAPTPTQRTQRSSRFLVPAGAAGRNASTGGAGNLQAAWASGGADYGLSPDAAYRHTVLLERGLVARNDITAESPAAALHAAAFTRPWQHLQAQPVGRRKLLVYAHGGLNSEAASVQRIRHLAPHALAQGIYPLFISWRSGPLETLGDLVQDAWARAGLGSTASPASLPRWAERLRSGLSEATDRMLEPLLRGPVGALWSQMKLNSQRAAEHEQGGVRLLAAELAALRLACPGLEIHLIGHSAGALVLGGLLDRLTEQNLSVASLRLMAPACTARYALDHFAPAVAKGVLPASRFWLDHLSDANEQADSIGPYRKSLLYLVSRALEDSHKMPLIGMAACYDPATLGPDAEDGMWSADHRLEAAQWNQDWLAWQAQGAQRQVLSASSVSDGRQRLRASHGCFDNAVDGMAAALARIVDPDHPPTLHIDRLDD